LDTKASQVSVNLIPTNPLLITDARLDNLDATVSSRLPTTSYVNNDVSGLQVQLDALPTLAEIEASTVLAKEATVAAVKTNSDLVPALL
jgi:hypothetical protein